LFLKYLHVDKDQQLVFAEMPRPEIANDECLIKVRAMGVNRADLLQKEGKYPPPKGESSVLGLEVSGDIVECGSQCSGWAVGDKVFGLVAGGGYAEYVVIKQGQLFSLPSSYSYQQGAANAEVFLTAYQSLFTIAKLKPNASVLIHAGASGVGTAAIQLAKSIGCHVVVTVSTKEKLDACIALGANEALNYKETDFVTWTKKNQPKGYDVILDVVAGVQVNKNISVANLDCHIVVLAMLGGRFTDPVDFAKMLFKRVTITASTLRNRSNDYKDTLVSNFKKDFKKQFESHAIEPVIYKSYPWYEANEAHQIMDTNQNIGKLVLVVS
jgi:putative PIG3 family NAD(P)H quinone oxidoreductase